MLTTSTLSDYYSNIIWLLPCTNTTSPACCSSTAAWSCTVFLCVRTLLVTHPYRQVFKRSSLLCRPLTALVLLSHIWDQFLVRVTPRAVAREWSKRIPYSLTSMESRKAGISFIGFELGVILNTWRATFTIILGSDIKICRKGFLYTVNTSVSTVL